MKKISMAAFAVFCTSILWLQLLAGPVITVKVDIGRKKYDCTRFGVCSVTLGAELRAGKPGRIAQATLNGKELTLAFPSLPGNENVMPVDERIPLDAKLAKQLGAEKLTILPGEYEVRRTRGRTLVVLNVE